MLDGENGRSGESLSRFWYFCGLGELLGERISRGDFYALVELGVHYADPVVDVPPLSCVPVPSAVAASAKLFSFLSFFDFS